MKKLSWVFQLTFSIILSLFIVLSTTAKVAEADTIKEIELPLSTPLVRADGGIDFPYPDNNHWWIIDYWNETGGSLPTKMIGSFIAVKNTFTELIQDDAVLYLPLNVAYGTSPTNCVWFQFDLQMNNPLNDIDSVDMLIWDIRGPGDTDDDYRYTIIPFDYIAGHEYYFSLTPSGSSTITFFIQDKTTSVSWSISNWHWKVPNTNLLVNASMFSPASAVEGYTTISTFLNVPFFQTKVGENISAHQHEFTSTEFVPSGITTTCFAVGASGFWNWEMQRPPNIFSNLKKASSTSSAASAVEGYATVTAFSNERFFHIDVGDDILAFRYPMTAENISSGISGTCLVMVLRDYEIVKYNFRFTSYLV
jgi:hypothetical protein